MKKIMAKNRFYNKFTTEQLLKGKAYMLAEIKQAPKEYQNQLKELFWYYWRRFRLGKFTVDGATFIDEEDGDFFNIWWFIHDGRNAEGFVGVSVDNEMIDIMTLTDTPAKHFKQAVPLLKLTWVNWLRHLFKGSLQRNKPNDLIVIIK